MLDDQDYIQRIDSGDGLGVVAAQVPQLEFAPDITYEPSETPIENIVVAGMGGSALAAGLCKNWWNERLRVPLEVVHDYRLPAYVDKTTLLICSSYSGNTEEIISAYQDGSDRDAQRVVVAHGGKLKDMAVEDKVPFIELPETAQPRMATWYGVKALALLMEKTGLLEGVSDELLKAQSLLHAAVQEWEVDAPTDANQAKQIAEQLMGKTVWIYAGSTLARAAHKWKINLNENSKNVANWNVFPELNHNEFLGWTSHPVDKPFAVVELRSVLDHPQTQKRFDVTNQLLSGQMPAPIEVEAKGQTPIEQLLWTCLLGDFVSIYLGILNGVNPLRIDAIEKLKKELA